MSYGVQTFSAAGATLVDSQAVFNGVVVAVVTIPANSGTVTYSYPEFAGCTLLAAFNLASVSVQQQARELSGSPPSITLQGRAYQRTMFIICTAGAPPDATGYGISCRNDFDSLLPVHHIGGAASLVLKTATATAIGFSTPYNGTWNYGWRYTVTTHEYEPLVFIVPPAMSGASAGMWLERLAHVSGGLGAKVWEIDVGCYSSGVRTAAPTILVFDRRTVITSGENYGIQVFDAAGKKTYDSNDGKPLRVAGLLQYGSYYGTSPYNGALNASLPGGINAAIQLNGNSSLVYTTVGRGSSGVDYYSDFYVYRNNSGVINRAGYGYRFASIHDPEPTPVGTTTTYDLEAASILVINADEY